MRGIRRAFQLAGLVALLVNAGAAGAAAQGFPNNTVHIITGSPIGGGGDIVARLIGQELSQLWHQPVVVEAKEGAFMSIAVTAVARSPADGYTMAFLNSSVLGMGLHPELPVNLERDLAPVSTVAQGPILLVVAAEFPARNLKELIQMARDKPGKLNYGSAGVGTSTHFTGELLNMLAGVNIVHVPYDGGPKAMTAVLGGEIQMSWPNIAAAKALLAAGKLRALGIATSERSPSMPDVPTIAEAGVPGYEYSSWFGFFAPAATPKDILARLHDAIVKVAESPDVKQKLAQQGFDPATSSPDQFKGRIHSDLEQFIMLSNKIGLKN